MLGMVASLYHADYNDIRSLLRKVRMGAGFTQVQMADALDVGQSYVSNWNAARTLLTFFCTHAGAKPVA